MARISQYQVDANISDNDQLLGTDAEDANVTKKFTVRDLSAYINGQSSGSPGSGTVTSVSGTGSVSGITLSGTVTASGELTLGGALEIDPADITSAIGYTPYDASNPDGFTSFDGDYDSLTNKPTIYNEPAIFSGGGTPTLASGVTAEEIRTLIGAGSGEGSGTVTSVDATAGTGISVSGGPITASGTITITNTAPDTGVPAILSDGSVPTLNTGITAEEIRNLIGAGEGTMSYFSISAGIVSDFISQGNTIRFDGEGGIDIVINPVPEGPDYIRFINTAPDTGVPAILSNGSTPTLNTGITAEEIRTLIGAGDGTGSIESVSGTAPIISSGGATPVISISAATTSAAGSMSAADKTKLDGVAEGAQVNVGTDLSKTASTTDVTINSSTGANVSIGAASTSSAGVMTKALYDNVIANNAKVSNVTTNLGYTGSISNGVVTSSDGTNATLPLVVSGGNAGLMTGGDKAKLDSIDDVSTNFVKNTSDTFSSSPKVNQIVTLTQAEYDGITPSSSTLYIIVD